MKHHAKFTKLKVALLALGLLGSLSACSKKEGNSDQQPNGSAKGFGTVPEKAGDKSRYKPMPETGSPVGLGYAVDLNNETGISNRCVDGTMETIPVQDGAMFLDANFTRKEIDSYLSASASGSVSFLAWGASASGSYSQKLREDSYGLNYIMLAYHKDKSEVFLPSARTEMWKLASPTEFRANCGDGYIAARDKGSLIIVKFSLALDEKSERKDWGASGGGHFLSFAKLRTQIQGNSGKKISTGALSVSIYQRGGKPAEIGKLLKAPDSESGLVENFALCSVHEVEKCLKSLRSIETYVADVFPKQIDDKENGGSAVIMHYPFIYPISLGADFNPGVDAFVVNGRKLLDRLYTEELDDVARLLADANVKDAAVESMIAKARANVSAIREAAKICYETESYQQCAPRAEELIAACAETDVSNFLNDEAAADPGANSGE